MGEKDIVDEVFDLEELELDWEATGGEHFTSLVEMWVTESQNLSRLMTHKDVRYSLTLTEAESKGGVEAKEILQKFKGELERQFDGPISSSRQTLRAILRQLNELAKRNPGVFKSNPLNWAVCPVNLVRALRKVLPGDLCPTDEEIETGKRALQRRLK